MLPSVIRRVLVAQHCADFRKRFDGLLGESYRLSADPYAGDCIVFLKGDHTQLRALIGDKLGLFFSSAVGLTVDLCAQILHLSATPSRPPSPWLSWVCFLKALHSLCIGACGNGKSSLFLHLFSLMSRFFLDT